MFLTVGKALLIVMKQIRDKKKLDIIELQKNKGV